MTEQSNQENDDNSTPEEEPSDYVQELVRILDRLRGENGCPWDREQTHRTLKECLVEETAELCDAIDDNNDDNMAEELGDVLLQVVFHCQIAAEEKRFNLQDIARGICQKLIWRHPHVFSNTNLEGADEVIHQWGRIKRAEKKRASDSRLAGVPRSLSALHRAHNIQGKAAKAGFDWPAVAGVIAKIEEELAEVRKAIECEDDRAIGEEIGDLLFSVVNLSRWQHHLAEDLLHATVKKFQNRFEKIEKSLAEVSKSPEDCSIDELERLWQEAKRD